MVFDLDQEIKEINKGAEEAEGKLHKQYEDDKLMSSVLAGDKQTVDQAELIQEATNKGIGAFTPDLLFASITKNFSIAKQLYGEKILRLLTGYEPNSIEKNLKIPEFKKELQRAIYETVQKMKDDKLLDEEGIISEKGTELGALILIKELDHYITKDKTGDKINKHHRHYGDKTGTRNYRQGDRYKEINIKKTIHNAIKRQHKKITVQDISITEREGKGKVTIILALDASSSMKGKKIENSKKAAIALAYKAINDKDEVGLVVFGSEIKKTIPPTRDFTTLLNAISTIKTSMQTDFTAMINKSIELFPHSTGTKHLIIITDALPTTGKKPEEETLQAISKSRGAGITTSLIGVQLDRQGSELARQITQIGEGRLSLVKDLTTVGTVMLEDYYAIR